MRVLILGGTTEASALARLLAGDPRFEATLSLAGRTLTPRAQPIATRIGGFGGAQGLAQFLRAQAIEAVVDATHPYADQISANAVAACAEAGIALASIVRPAWQSQPDDRWQVVPNADAAASALGQTPRRVFLSLGRLELHSFAGAPQHHYVARTIDPPQQAVLPPDISFLQARGPFDRTAETRLLRDEKIDVIVSKNSGGIATYPKIESARELGLPVVMIARPDKPVGHVVRSPEEAVAWLGHDGAPRSLRGV
ncbi:MAG: cobalt-precorrin-6A reductase [Reyranellales bacterium]